MVSGSLWPKHRAMLNNQDLCWWASARWSDLDILLMLKSCLIYFCSNRRKLLKPHCSLETKKGKLWTLAFYSQGHYQGPTISLVLYRIQEKTWLRQYWGPFLYLWAKILTGCCKLLWVAGKQFFVPSDSIGRESEPGLGQ